MGNIVEATIDLRPDLTLIRSDAAALRRKETGVRQYEGVDMREVYARKSRAYKFLKRAFDIVASILGMLLLSPVFLAVAIAIKLEDGGPVFFTGMRYGKDLKLFPMYKFRSMCVDAEGMTDTVLTDDDKNGMAFKIKDDPRITKVGHFIRRTSLDELPQLLNVLKGEMSLVGPRPIQTISTPTDPYEMQRWIVRPGLTGIWQVSGRALVPWNEWVEMDLRYIYEMSILPDLGLVFKTFGAVADRKGAN